MLLQAPSRYLTMMVFGKAGVWVAEERDGGKQRRMKVCLVMSQRINEGRPRCGAAKCCDERADAVLFIAGEWL